ncbi:hypothetical protein DPMN_150426 [Dreissena polymorpha]|uniref:Uncharacterized protein n=1 Tax=Dreissena polymorpha TaxID=45954 RepID=A0A9D4J225_DREPO|nr:hypothetical protein DPMN_150426 [Dreissena polymorpha]
MRAVSPAGDGIYVTNKDQDKPLTLAMDGTLISTFTDHELHGVYMGCSCYNCGTSACLWIHL